MSDVTRILDAIHHGDPSASDELLPLVYEELRKLAAHRMANEAPGQTLQATALVHEAWLRLTANENQPWNGRGHFFGAAAEAMRRILIDRARSKGREKRGGQGGRVDIPRPYSAREFSWFRWPPVAPSGIQWHPVAGHFAFCTLHFSLPVASSSLWPVGIFANGTW